jgi:pimeloyl-ACP methyl ester carboxylesterase
LRVVSVERNGFGGTRFDPRLGYDDAAADVLELLGALAIERFAVVAFSGGAPFAAALAARAPRRVISLHLAAAAMPPLAAASAAASALLSDPDAIAADPEAFWRFPPKSPVHLVPGFAEAAAREGPRALGGRGGAALAHEWRLLRGASPTGLRGVRAPAYLYAGDDDEIVTCDQLEAWRRALPTVVAVRRYAGEAHDVQYRHWDQILFDAAGVSALGQLTLVCQDGAARLVGAAQLQDRLAAGATLGLCAWATGGETKLDLKGTA